MKLLATFITFSLLLCSVNGWATESPEIKKSSRMYVSHFENVLGTSLELKIHAGSEKQSRVAETAALVEIARMAKIVSAYDNNSEFSKWMKTSNEAKPISPELFELLSLFDEWRTKGGGA